MGRSVTLSLALLVALFWLPGCGGQGSEPAQVTSRSEVSLDPDAPLLAAREVGGYTVPLELARSLDKTLREARQAFPELATVRAASTYHPHELHFALSNDAPWLAQWRAGNLATGIPELDTLFEDFEAKHVVFVREEGDQSWFSVTFDTFLRAHRAAGLFIGKSDALRIASAVSVSSGETDIHYERAAPDTTRLTFTQGEKSTVLERTGGGSWVKKSTSSP